MRTRRALDESQIKFLLEHCDWTNEKLANHFKISKSLIATYKYRARLAGINVPKQPTRTGTIQIMKELASK